MSNENIDFRIGRNMCLDDFSLYFNSILLLYEKIYASTKNGSLNATKWCASIFFKDNLNNLYETRLMNEPKEMKTKKKMENFIRLKFAEKRFL